MVNLIYVGPLLGWQEMLRKFSFAVTCFYSLEKWRSLLEIEINSALFHSRDPMYTLRRWSSVFDINNHKFRLSTFVNRNVIHRCNRKLSHLKGSKTSEANKSRVTRARLLRLQIWKGECKTGNWKHTKSSTAEVLFQHDSLYALWRTLIENVELRWSLSYLRSRDYERLHCVITNRWRINQPIILKE